MRKRAGRRTEGVKEENNSPAVCDEGGGEEEEGGGEEGGQRGFEPAIVGCVDGLKT